MDAVTPTDMPTTDDPEAFAVALVQTAIDHYKTEGREVAIAYHNDPANIDGQWYVFIIDTNDLFVAHPAAPEFIGKSIKEVPGLDGSLIGLEIAMATEEGRWTEYLWPNPETNKLELKRTWSIRHDGYLFAAGYYEPWGPDPATLTLASKEDPKAFTHDLVLAAVARYESEGVEATAAYHNDPENIDGQWYVFITDENNIYLAHPVKPEFIGRDITQIRQIPGIDGTVVGAEIAMATEVGRWIEYLWPNPETNKLEQKRTWAIRHDGYLFAAGYYEPWGPDPATLPVLSKDDPEEFTRSIVLAAIARYEFEGVAATAAYYNDPENIDGQWYVLITDENDIHVAHPLRPDFIGTDIKDIPGLDGSPLGAEIAMATETGLWIEYLWPNPESGEVELKRTWAIRHDGYLFGAGYYKPTAENAAPMAEEATP